MKKSHPQINMLVLCTQTIIPLLIFPSVYNYIQNEHIVNKQEKYKEKPGITFEVEYRHKSISKAVQKQPRNFFGMVPVARYFADVSSALRSSSPRLASTIAFFSSACLWIKAALFFIFSA